MDKVCRLCLRLEANMTSIFYGTNKTSDLQLQIQDLCSMEISQNDALPKMICDKCKEKLFSIQTFRNQCIHSDSKLREHYQILTSARTYESLFKVLQDVSVQTENNIEDSSLPKHSVRAKKEKNSSPAKHSVRARKKKDSSEVVTPVSLKCPDTDDDGKYYKEPNLVANELCLENNYNCEISQVKKHNLNLRKSPRRKSDIILCKRELRSIKKKETFMCHTCAKVYASKKTLLKHTKTHMKEEILICEICSKEFYTSKKLAEHIKRHNKEMDLKCEVCGMPFKEQVKLNFHLRVHGRGPPINTDKQYLCDMCSKTFASKSGLRYHLKLHAGYKPYTCKYCNKGFPINSYKNRHERTHTGDKHFICHICSTGFASANGLKYHVRSHTGEANFHCSTCGKSFRRRNHLKEHTFTHTGERPFACKICGSAYGNSGSLFVHEKKCKAQYALSIIAESKLVVNGEVKPL